MGSDVFSLKRTHGEKFLCFPRFFPIEIKKIISVPSAATPWSPLGHPLDGCLVARGSKEPAPWGCCPWEWCKRFNGRGHCPPPPLPRPDAGGRAGPMLRNPHCLAIFAAHFATAWGWFIVLPRGECCTRRGGVFTNKNTPVSPRSLIPPPFLPADRVHNRPLSWISPLTKGHRGRWAERPRGGGAWGVRWMVLGGFPANAPGPELAPQPSALPSGVLPYGIAGAQ